MIVFDTPRSVRFRHFRLTAHCASTLPGEAGTAELLAFGALIGLRPTWLQHRGEPKEHFDLFDGRIEAARKAGAAQVTGAEYIQFVVWPKRAAAKRGAA